MRCAQEEAKYKEKEKVANAVNKIIAKINQTAAPKATQEHLAKDGETASSTVQ